MISPGKPFCNKVEKCLIITGGLDYMNVGFLLLDLVNLLFLFKTTSQSQLVQLLWLGFRKDHGQDYISKLSFTFGCTQDWSRDDPNK